MTWLLDTWIYITAHAVADPLNGFTVAAAALSSILGAMTLLDYALDRMAFASNDGKIGASVFCVVAGAFLGLALWPLVALGFVGAMTVKIAVVLEATLREFVFRPLRLYVVVPVRVWRNQRRNKAVVAKAKLVRPSFAARVASFLARLR